MAQATKTRGQGKSQFLKEYLHDNPRATARAVNEAWRSAGMDGSISESLVNNMRSKLGLTGNLRARSKGTKKAAQKGGKAVASGKGTTGKPLQLNTRSRQIADLESEIDRLIFKAMHIGGLARIEESLRETRRLLYRTIG
jgi:hypothetical protein